ncbi:hypothetical protein SNEBB_004230 [Seison nebaliae]|nr:hypothetical protein SNEBB_004230 [Seison nebaliae]
MDPSTYKVELYIYDLSRGMSRIASQAFLGRYIEGFWHTGVVVYGREYFFGSNGINYVPPCGTILGTPDRKMDLGTTTKTKKEFEAKIVEWSKDVFKGERYHILEHNCNSFSNTVAQYLCSVTIPTYITDMPSEFLQTPMGKLLEPLINDFQVIEANRTRRSTEPKEPNVNNHNSSYRSFLRNEPREKYDPKRSTIGIRIGISEDRKSILGIYDSVITFLEQSISTKQLAEKKEQNDKLHMFLVEWRRQCLDQLSSYQIERSTSLDNIESIVEVMPHAIPMLCVSSLKIDQTQMELFKHEPIVDMIFGELCEYLKSASQQQDYRRMKLILTIFINWTYSTDGNRNSNSFQLKQTPQRALEILPLILVVLQSFKKEQLKDRSVRDVIILGMTFLYNATNIIVMYREDLQTSIMYMEGASIGYFFMNFIYERELEELRAFLAPYSSFFSHKNLVNSLLKLIYNYRELVEFMTQISFISKLNGWPSDCLTYISINPTHQSTFPLYKVY